MSDLFEINVKVDEAEVERIVLEELQKRLKAMELRQTFWDIKELQRQTCMSRPAIMEHLFSDKRFQKILFKIGAKWYMPAEETRDFLLRWAKEQREINPSFR